MSSLPRFRAVDSRHPNGYIEFYSIRDVSTRLAYDHRCSDIDNKPPKSGSPFNVEKWKSYGGFMNGRAFDRECSNFTPLLYQDISASHSDHLPFANRPTDSSLATSLMKRANPESTGFNAPLFLFELRELPSLLRQAKDLIVSPVPKSSIPQGLGSLWLQAQFGWKPLLSDLWNLILFADSIDKRARKFQEIYDKGGITVKRSLYRGKSRRSYYQSFANSLFAMIDANVDIRSSTHVSGYVKYVPKITNIPPATDRDVLLQARSVFLGLNFRPADLWDAFPWSWMVDYFLNVGDFIAAHQGNLYFDTVEYALMEYTETVFKADYVSVFPPTDTHVVTHESKRRWTPPLSLDVNFETPILSAYQSSILGSLLLARKS